MVTLYGTMYVNGLHNFYTFDAFTCKCEMIIPEVETVF